jgi:hypothetical protein
MKNIIAIRMLSIIALFIFFFPTLADIDPLLAPSAEDSLIEEDFLQETSHIKIVDSRGRLTTDSIEALEGIDYNLQASNTDVQTRGLFHNGISYILVSNPYGVPKMVVVNPQISDWNMKSVQVKYGDFEVEKIWNLLQIRVPAFRSGLIVIHPSDLEGEHSTGHNYPRNTLASEEKTSTGYNYPGDTLANEEIPSTEYNYHVETLTREEKPSTEYNYPGETLASDEIPSKGYNYPEERYRSLWETSIVKVDAYGQLTVDGLSGVDYDLQSSNSDVLTRGLFYNGIAYILVANPNNMPKKVIVNPQKSNWYIQNVQVKYGTLMVSKVGNLLQITVPGCQSALIIITPQKKRYSFTSGPKPAYSSSAGPKPAYSSGAGPKPTYSFCAGPKPAYSFRAGPKPSYSFRIGY